MNFHKQTVPSLRQLARTYGVKVSGKKAILIERIQQYLKENGHATSIQRIFRGYLVRRTLYLRGVHLDMSQYVNCCDPVTLEPLNEIYPLLFSNIHVNGYRYGFNIKSLIDIIRQSKRRVINPFNREPIPYPVIKNILKQYRHTILIDPHLVASETDISPLLHTPYTPTEGFSYSSLRVVETYYRPIPYSGALSGDTNIELYERLCSLRIIPLSPRIQDVFSEMCRLGNYVDASWFHSMPQRCYPRFYLCLHHIWNTQATLSNAIKKKICRIFDPFSNAMFNETIHISLQMTLNEVNACQVRLGCVCAMETMVMSAVDDEYAKLGAMYVLMALTTVSRSARVAMPWLYESITG